jgi:hypothetical protein
MKPWLTRGHLGRQQALRTWQNRGPTAVRASALMLSALLSFAVGLMLNAITHSHREIKRPAYLAAGC